MTNQLAQQIADYLDNNYATSASAPAQSEVLKRNNEYVVLVYGGLFSDEIAHILKLAGTQELLFTHTTRYGKSVMKIQ